MLMTQPEHLFVQATDKKHNGPTAGLLSISLGWKSLSSHYLDICHIFAVKIIWTSYSRTHAVLTSFSIHLLKIFIKQTDKLHNIAS